MWYSEVMELPLHGRRILVPPSRLGPNPLVTMLERQGAQVPVFPALVAGDVDTAPMDEAISELGSFGFLVMAGEASVHRLLERLAEAGRGPEALPPRRVAIGHGAVVALRRVGQEATVKPRDHFAAGVADAMGPVRGQAISGGPQGKG